MVQVCVVSFGGIVYVEVYVSCFEVVIVVDLVVGFGVEWCLVEDYDVFFVFFQVFDGLVVFEQCDDLFGVGDVLIVEEVGFVVDFDQVVVVYVEGVGSVGVFVLGFYFVFEVVFVDGQFVFVGDVIGQVDWEVIGVVQFEYYVVGNYVVLQFGEVLFEDFQVLFQGFGELFFFGFQYVFDVCLLLFQFGEGIVYFGDQCCDDFVEEGVFGVQFVVVVVGVVDDLL